MLSRNSPVSFVALLIISYFIIGITLASAAALSGAGTVLDMLLGILEVLPFGEFFFRITAQIISSLMQTTAISVDALVNGTVSSGNLIAHDWIKETCKLILAAGFTPYIVATKSDKIKRSQLARQTAMIRRTIKEKSKVSHDVSFEVIPFSGLNKAGREDLYNIIDGFLTKENDMV